MSRNIGLYGKKVRRFVAVADLRKSAFNAALRYTDSRLEALREEILHNNNVIEKEISVSKDLVIADGARRFTIASELGLESVWCDVYEDVRSGTPEFDSLFRLLNRGNAGYTPKDRLWTVLKGGPAFTPADRNMAKKITDTLFEAEFQIFMNSGAPKDVWSNSRTTATFILHPGKKDTDSEVVRDINKLVAWCVRNKQVQNLKHFLEGYRDQRPGLANPKFDPVDLRKALDKDKPLKDSIKG